MKPTIKVNLARLRLPIFPLYYKRAAITFKVDQYYGDACWPPALITGDTAAIVFAERALPVMVRCVG